MNKKSFVRSLYNNAVSRANDILFDKISYEEYAKKKDKVSESDYLIAFVSELIPENGTYFELNQAAKNIIKSGDINGMASLVTISRTAIHSNIQKKINRTAIWTLIIGLILVISTTIGLISLVAITS